ncbi:hypothetical protein D770_20515 [Flammeovirgaceae bacterium 311]|nr:hypothetical protein D770_20515 [Flammeovirgaceae bacterium 311]
MQLGFGLIVNLFKALPYFILILMRYYSIMDKNSKENNIKLFYKEKNFISRKLFRKGNGRGTKILTAPTL